MKIEDFRAFALENMMAPEEVLSEVYTSYVDGQQGFSMFDGGAHKAFHTKRMLDLEGCERVYAVEADPFMAKKCLDALSKSHGEDDRLLFVEKALQNDPAVTSIPWMSSVSHVGRSSILSQVGDKATIWGEGCEIEYRETMEVSATTIDMLLEGEGLSLKFIKLDLEGADLLALMGAKKTLERFRPIVAFENSIHAPKVHGFTIDQILTFFSGLNYVPMNFIGEPIGPENWFGFFEAWAAPREASGWLSQKVNALCREKVLAT